MVTYKYEVVMLSGFSLRLSPSRVDRHSSHCDQDSKSPHDQTNAAHRKPAEAARLRQVWEWDCVSKNRKKKEKKIICEYHSEP